MVLIDAELLVAALQRCFFRWIGSNVRLIVSSMEITEHICYFYMAFVSTSPFCNLSSFQQSLKANIPTEASPSLGYLLLKFKMFSVLRYLPKCWRISVLGFF